MSLYAVSIFILYLCVFPVDLDDCVVTGASVFTLMCLIILCLHLSCTCVFFLLTELYSNYIILILKSAGTDNCNHIMIYLYVYTDGLCSAVSTHCKHAK